MERVGGSGQGGPRTGAPVFLSEKVVGVAREEKG